MFKIHLTFQYMLLSKLNLRKRKTIIDISFFHSSDCGFNIQGPPCEVTTCTFSTTYQNFWHCLRLGSLCKILNCDIVTNNLVTNLGKGRHTSQAAFYYQISVLFDKRTWLRKKHLYTCHMSQHNNQDKGVFQEMNHEYNILINMLGFDWVQFSCVNID